MSNNYEMIYDDLLEFYEELSVILLTKKSINEGLIDSLNKLFEGISQEFSSNELVPKKIVSILFKLYIMTHTEISFREPNDKINQRFLALFQNGISTVF